MAWMMWRVQLVILFICSISIHIEYDDLCIWHRYLQNAIHNWCQFDFLFCLDSSLNCLHLSMCYFGFIHSMKSMKSKLSKIYDNINKLFHYKSFPSFFLFISHFCLFVQISYSLQNTDMQKITVYFLNYFCIRFVFSHGSNKTIIQYQNYSNSIHWIVSIQFVYCACVEQIYRTLFKLSNQTTDYV